ncbi:amino acid adenylation domain-containing protein [Paenibacillus sp. ACRRX]|uniref:non-ribosomal peptide synthetase n=1 Tax=Paenibacillus sp. ACRRX TaxID=2918206 RepID=UPI001EF4745C|nr:non-ribosomal peptide synthetase [Paenibacillus sp. ACRRX]MCG7406875.1 amino acid adenylation domain-containing protein [Paenibacillus sp. ACRRX]
MFQLQLLENEALEKMEDDKLDGYIAEASLHDIAIIGISAKLPLSATYDQFWECLQQGVDAVGPFPDSRRLQMKPYLNKLRVNEERVVFFEGAYLEDVSEFDYAFFRLSPHEAALMSPNQRMFLQTAWRAIEDAGYGGDGLRDTRTGVFVGHNADTLHDYKRVLETLSPQSLSLAAAGNLSPMIASRISYLLNFRGPSLSIDTACSSSLVAIHLACQSLRNGECDTALAGSVKLNLLPMDTGIRLGIEASDYRAKPFDEAADGTGIGEGVVAFVLKPLHKAEQDNDYIYAVIKGGAMNQDGASVGITAPNAVAQEDVIIRAWQDAGIDPETVSYMEAHGTGTALGDPIEIEGMTRAFRRYTGKRQLCAIGSVKSNVGHLDHAAGMVGMLKAVLALRARQLPATLHFQQPNRSLSLTESPLYVNDRLSAWKPHEEHAATPLRCGVSAFGMSGTNCHIVLEEAARLDVCADHPALNTSENRFTTQSAAAKKEGRWHLFTLSAQTKAALRRMAAEYALRIASAPASWSLADVCYTAHIGRGHYAYRLAILACDLQELVVKLRLAGEQSDFIDKMMMVEQECPSSFSFADMSTTAITDPKLEQVHSTCGETIMDGIYGGRVSEFLFAEAGAQNSTVSDQLLLADKLTNVSPDWLEDNRLVQKLAQSYIQGAYISWDRLYGNQVYRKLPLPGYSFEPTQCWVEPAAVSSWDSLFLTGDPGQETELPPDLAVEMKTILADWRRRYETWLSTRNPVLPHVRLIASRSLTGSDYDTAQVLVIGEDYNSVEQQIADWWGDTLGYEELELNRSFFELGGDSIMALKVMNLIYDKWQIRLEAAQLFASPTIKQLAHLVAERINESLHDDPIPRLPEQETYAVSPAQRRLYLQQQAAPADKSYNLPETLRLEGALDVIKLEQALQTLIARHEMLRGSFLIEDGEIRQRISDKVPFHLPLIEANESEMSELLRSHHAPFQLEQAPLLRAALFRISEVVYVLFLDMHHIVSDGTSTGLLIKEIMTLYTDGELLEQSVSYRDYAAWQLERSHTEAMEAHRRFWLNQGLMDMPVLELPTDFARPPVKSNVGETFDVYVSAELTAKLHRLAQAQHCTLFPVLLSAYYTLLANYSNQTDIAVGTPIAGRSRTELESVIGMFVNTVVLRSYPESDKTYLEYVKEVQDTILACMEHQYYPFEELVLGHERFDPSRSPLFDTMFVMQNLDMPELKLGEVQCIHQRYDHRTAKYDLMVQAVERGEQLRLVVEYSAALFRRETVQVMMNRYVYLLEQMVEAPHLTLGSYRILTAEEELELRTSICSNVGPSFGEIEGIHRRMERMTQLYPARTAVECGPDKLSYREVNEQANRLARALRTNGVSKGTIVAVMAERSVRLIVGLLAVLKAGGAYMPIDPSNPADRKMYMLQDSGASVLLIEGENQTLPFAGVSIDLASDQWLAGEASNLDLPTDPDDLMYVIYTSGSTGRPKGVMIAHSNFYNFAYSMNALYENTITPEDRFLSLTNLSFDVSVCEMFTPLMFGATLVFYPDSGVLDVRAIARSISGSGITFAYLPPTLLGELAALLEKHSDSLRLNKLLVGVEPIKDSTLAKFKRLNPEMRIINGYGPTESTVCSNMYVFQEHVVEGRNVPIGKPMHNVEVYLLGYGNKIVPTGITGELCIAGAGLARGYWNKPELTAERFVRHPLFQDKTLYRTGDLAKWQPEGNAVFIGRIDHQVKIRGYRIELGEIEVHLCEYEGIRQVLAVTREEEHGLKYICAYIVGDQNISGLTLRKFLAARLPEYMIPSYFVSLPAIPLTANGKVDRHALPEPDKLAALSETRVKPRTEKEMMVAELFRDILGIPDAGIHEHFFELGGHSLKATMLVSRLSQMFNEEIPVSVAFERPTVAELAEYLEERELVRGGSTDRDNMLGRAEQTREVIASTVRADRYPTTAAQHRLYLLDQLHNDSVAYNMPAAVEVVGNLDYKALAEALQGLVDRHESLRTSFAADHDKSVQVVHEKARIVLTERQAVAGEEKKIMGEFVRPFDLATFPLIRVELVTLVSKESDSEQLQTKNMLLFDMHHIISDGFSMAVLMKDLTALYAGVSLAPLSIQMKDVAVWQERQLQGTVMLEQEQYWLGVFQGELPILKLPADYKRPELQSYEGSQIWFEVDRELSARIRTSAKTCGVTLYTYLLAGYFTLLSRYSGQEDIVVGTPVAGRTQIQMEQIVGMMVNTVAIRSEANPDLTIKEYVSRLQRRIIEAMERQHYPFERLVDKLFTARDTSRNPLFDTMFIMQNMDKAELKAAGVQFKPIQLEQQMSKFDLTLEAAEDNHILRFHLEYATRLFEPATVARMARHYVKLLAEMAADPARQLKELELLGADELDLLLTIDNKKEHADELCGSEQSHGEQLSISDNRMKRVYQLIDEQAAKTPQAIAIICGGVSITYYQLNERANQLAYTLRQRGVGPGCIVALLAGRSTELLIGLLAILKAGGAYVAIDPSFPRERIELMLEDCGTKLVLTERAYAGSLHAAEEWLLDDPDMYADNKRAAQLEQVNHEHDLAYILYTSGSTGRPKGVMIEHKGLSHFIDGFAQRFEMAEGQAILGLATVSFDIFIVETLLPLTLGMKIVLANDEEKSDTTQLSELIRKHHVQVLQTTPSRTKWWIAQSGDLSAWQNLHILMIGAEPLSRHLLSELQSSTKARIYNLYGPTETTVWTAVQEVTHVGRRYEEQEQSPLQSDELLDQQPFNLQSHLEPAVEITIGTPIAGAEMLVLNADGRLQPIGVLGEIHIGGDGLGRGYMAHEDWTMQAFVDHPYRQGEKLYRTGDIGRRLSNGQFAFAGRRDHQVKIRGHRIELGEIEHQLLALQYVKDAVIHVWSAHHEEGDVDDCELCAYIVCSDEITTAQLRQGLQRKLPEYMVPTYYVKLDAIPLTPTGKVDRKALPQPGQADIAGERIYAELISDTEKSLASIWQDVLSLDRIGAEDHFFDQGGHSLKAAMLVNRVREQFGVNLLLSEVFQYPTLAEMASRIDTLEPESFLEGQQQNPFADILEPIQPIAPYDNMTVQGSQPLSIGTDMKKDDSADFLMNAASAVQSVAATSADRVFRPDTAEEQQRSETNDSRSQIQAQEQQTINVETRVTYPLSSAQKRQFILQHLGGDTTAYHLPVAVAIEGEIDCSKLEQALTSLIERQSSLRTSFEMVDGEPVQRVEPVVAFKIDKAVVDEEELYDNMGWDDEALSGLMKTFVRPFDLQAAPLLRVRLVTLVKKIALTGDLIVCSDAQAQSRSNNRHLLLIDMHHIISDGISLMILVRELAALYGQQQLVPLSVSYTDYASVQHLTRESDRYKQDEGYWLSTMSGELPVLELPTDMPRPRMKSNDGKCHYFHLDAKLTSAAKQLARAEGTTLYTVMLTAYTTLLHQLTGQDDIIVGTPVAGRDRSDLEHVIGMFVSTVLVRSRTAGSERIRQRIQRMHSDLMQAFEHQAYPFEDLVDKLAWNRDAGRNPLFDTLFALQNMDVAQMSTGKVSFRPLPFERRASQFDLTFEAAEAEQGIRIRLEYATALFKHTTIERMAEQYRYILQQMTSSPDTELDALALLDDKQQQILLAEWDLIPTLAMKSTAMPVYRLIEQQAAMTPDRTAIWHEGREVTYRELDDGAAQFAVKLRTLGVGPDRIVGILMGRSPALVTAILAIHKAGGAYMPIDPAYPQDRIQYMLRDSGTTLVLTDHTTVEIIEGWGEQKGYNRSVINADPEKTIEQQAGEAEIGWNGSVLDIESWLLNLNKYGADQSLESNNYSALNDDHYPSELNAVACTDELSRLAYVMYTSGSTGRPKGVMVEQRGLSHYIDWARGAYVTQAAETFAFYSSIAFDLTITSLFVPLTGGHRLIIYGDDLTIDVILQRIMTEGQVTIAKLTPAHLTLLPGMDITTSTVHSLIVGGEELSTSVAARISKNWPIPLAIYNEYGPTETVVGCMLHLFDELADKGPGVPIGKPIAETAIYVLDASRRLVPPGVIGEIYIGGAGVARGYWQRAELTLERFVLNPFRSNERMYRTGDLARITSRGLMEYVGRVDHQVKINGYRIELGEIEACVTAHPCIDQAVVINRSDMGGAMLCCYYSIRNEHSLEATAINMADAGLREEELRSYLAASLPVYMIPAHLIELPALPLTQSGKIDRQSLPKPVLTVNEDDTQSYIPTTDAEATLVGIWREVLRIGQVGLRDNFFRAGGNSLLLIQVYQKLDRHYPDLLRVTDLFAYPTIKDLAEQITRRQGDSSASGLASVVLLDEMMVERAGAYEETTLQAKVDRNMQPEWFAPKNDTAVQNERWLEGVMAAYAYALYEASEGDHVPIHLVTASRGAESRAVVIPINMNTVSDITEYAEHVLQMHADVRTRVQLDSYEMRNLMKETTHQIRNAVYPLLAVAGKWEGSGSWLRKYGLQLVVDKQESEITLSLTFDAGLLDWAKMRELLQLIVELMNQLRYVTPDVGVISH